MCPHVSTLQCVLFIAFVYFAQANEGEQDNDYEIDHYGTQQHVGCNKTYCVRLCKEFELKSTIDETQNGTSTESNMEIQEALVSAFNFSLDDVGFEYGDECPVLTRPKQLEAKKENLKWAEGQLIMESHNVSLSKNEFCVDFRDDGGNTAIVVEACLEIIQISIPKCCLSGQVLDINGFCVPDNVPDTALHVPYLDAATDTYRILEPIHVSARDGTRLECEGEVTFLNGTVNHESVSSFVVTANSKGESTLHVLQSKLFKQAFNYNEYCIDELRNQSLVAPKAEVDYAVMVQVCDPCRQRRCVKRCCGGNEHVNASEGVCQKYNLTLPQMSLIFEDQHRKSYFSTNYLEFPYEIGSVMGEFVHTAWDIALVQERHDFYVQDVTGYLRAPNYLAKNALIREYCIDYFIKDGAQPMIKAYFRETPQSEIDILALRFYPWFLFVSSGFLAATFVVYAVLKKWRKLQGFLVMNLVASMSLMFFCMGYIQYRGAFLNYIDCVLIASFTHFFFLAAFTWMVILSTDLLGKFRRIQLPKTKREIQFLKKTFHSVIGWGFPLLLEGITQLLRWYPEDRLPAWVVKPSFGQLRCWFSGYTDITLYFYMPLGILIGINTVSFIWAATAYYRSTVLSQVGALPGGHKQIRKRLFVSFRVFVLMGVSWLAEVISFVLDNPTWSMATDIWNMIQGILIFWMFVCKKDILLMIKKKLQNVGNLLREKFQSSFDSTSESKTGTGRSKESLTELKDVPSQTNLSSVQTSSTSLST